MSVHSVFVCPFPVSIPNEPWEAPPYPPPPPPPPAPPLPVLVQKEVETCFWDGNMFARPPPSVDDMEKEAEVKLASLNIEALKSFLGPCVAHLPYSEKDWSLTTKEIAAGGRCLVPAAGCSGFPAMDWLDDDFWKKIEDHLKTEVHLKHEEEKERECAGGHWIHVPQEPKFVMHRTMDIKFLDPPGLASSLEDPEVEKDGWLCV
ncbi:uncharacterized protein B0J16DRAFT_373786 [Fusarium flagelliforme]|uniref:uncharacterized protein n=1 Tax=Fusarium flagelliforme TaxID=2675880 RepID=UPI001E8EC773|nr:uncharacterized protein B0J16DRAFT_373786 [Fusarium flagelliforme]KAH7183299.1 hypothetical protein B0J16DRAFT_373786 [Fusarium flagelliforme]